MSVIERAPFKVPTPLRDIANLANGANGERKAKMYLKLGFYASEERCT